MSDLGVGDRSGRASGGTAADRRVRQGKALKGAAKTEKALAGGQIGTAQAGIIAGAIGDLPEGLADEQKRACEEALVGDDGKYLLKDMKSRSTRVVDRFQPEPEVDKADHLEDEERRAWKAAEFWMRPNGDGTTSESICAPKRDHLRDHPGAKPDAQNPDGRRAVCGEGWSWV